MMTNLKQRFKLARSSTYGRTPVTCLDCLFDLTVERAAPRRAATRDGHVVWSQ